MSLEALRELLRHMEWADALVWRALLAHPPAERDVRLRDLMSHLHTAQRVFLRLWTSQPLDSPDIVPSSQLADAHPRVRAYYRELHVALAGFDDATLVRPIVTPGLRRLGPGREMPTLADTVMQVVSHSTYHRGQVNARLREIGGEAPLVDYIAWIWFGRPAPEW